MMSVVIHCRDAYWNVYYSLLKQEGGREKILKAAIFRPPALSLANLGASHPLPPSLHLSFSHIPYSPKHAGHI